MSDNPFATTGRAGLQGDRSAAYAPSTGGAWGNGNIAAGAVPAVQPMAYDEPMVTVPIGSGPDPTLTSKEAQLNAREADIARREAELQRRQAAFNASGAVVDARNFPPCLPLVHHDIAADIPAHKQTIVRRGFTIYFLVIIALIYNLFGTCCALGYHSISGRVSAFFLALVYLLVGVPGAWWLWYSRLYKAGRTDGAFSYAAFFLMFLLHIAFCVWSAVSPSFFTTNWSHTGFMSAIKAFDRSAFLGIVYIVGAGVWSLVSAASVVFLFMVYADFRNSGGNERLQSEANRAAAGVAVNAAIHNASRR